jgi:hypothetical protein
MSEEEIVDLWNLFKDYIDSKQMELAAERYVDLLADYGVDDQTLVSVTGHHAVLDKAIDYYLDVSEEDNEDF